MIAPAFLEELRARVPVSEIVGRRVKLRRAGREWKGLSPFNKERTPSFYVNDQKCFYHDFSSGKHGDIIDFIQETEGLTFHEAVERIANLAGMMMPDGKTPTAAPAPVAVPQKPVEDDSERIEAAVRENRLRKARRLWSLRQPMPGTIAERYFRMRGYDGALPATIGFLPASGGYPPAVIAAYGIATEPEPATPQYASEVLVIADKSVCGVHLIKLKADGSDRLREDGAKITIGKGIAAPIMLAPPNDGLGLAIAEGIEDALIAHQATGLGAWAAGGATRLPMLADTIPDYVECVTILVDDNEAGRIGANELAVRIHHRFGRIEILMTPIGADL